MMGNEMYHELRRRMWRSYRHNILHQTDDHGLMGKEHAGYRVWNFLFPEQAIVVDDTYKSEGWYEE